MNPILLILLAALGGAAAFYVSARMHVDGWISIFFALLAYGLFEIFLPRLL